MNTFYSIWKCTKKKYHDFEGKKEICGEGKMFGILQSILEEIASEELNQHAGCFPVKAHSCYLLRFGERQLFDANIK